MENYNTNSLMKLINELEKMPGIGPRTAQRLAFHILKADKSEILNLSKAMEEVKDKMKSCPVCFNITETEPCAICASVKRDKSVICVVEEPLDVFAVEKTGAFNGFYHVLTGSISPLDGIGPEDLKIKELLNRVNNSEVKEIIIATNPDAEGEATGIYLTRLIKPLGIKVTRLALGIPMGASLEYTDEVTLGRALEGRRDL